MKEIIFEQLKNKRILILGFGKEGKSSLQFILKNKLSNSIGITDMHPINSHELASGSAIKKYCGPNYLDAIQHYEIILKAPGIKTSHLKLQSGQILSSQTDLFLRAFHQQTIGITGSKGKSTTSSLIFHLLQSTGKDCLITGNIGTPCFDSIEAINPQTIIVFELSAHQLEHLHRSPHIAVLLNLFEEHLDHFNSKEAYFFAKKNIFSKGTDKDILIIHSDLKQFAEDYSGALQYFPSALFKSVLHTPLTGNHNLLNTQAALLAVHAAGIPIDESIKHIQSFRPLPHRLEFLGCFDEVFFHNDSIATIPEASILAIQSLKKVDWLILGGFDRGINYDKLVAHLLEHPVRNIMFTGLAGARIRQQLVKAGYQGSLNNFETLEEAFDILKKGCKSGDVCLLSPAAASYDKYRNFEHRGDLFRQLAQNFKRNPD